MGGGHIFTEDILFHNTLYVYCLIIHFNEIFFIFYLFYKELHGASYLSLSHNR